jgi:hypothetical protein
MGEAAKRGSFAERQAIAQGRNAYHANERARLDQWLEARKPRERGRMVGVTTAALAGLAVGGGGWIPIHIYDRPEMPVLVNAPNRYGRTRPRWSK